MISLGTKTKYAVATLTLLGATTTPIISEPVEYHVRLKPADEGNFQVVDKSFDISGLQKANVIGEACYNEFKKEGEKTIRERTDCEEYWRVAHTPNYPAPFMKGYRWRGYSTQLFDTPSGDLEEGYYADGDIERVSIIEILTPKAAAAIALDATSNGDIVSVACSDTWSHTNAGNFLVLGSYGEDSTTADELLDSATFNGDALTSSEAFTGDTVSVDIWYLANPDIGTFTMSVTYCASGSLAEGGAGVVSYSGVDGFDADGSLSFSNDSTPSISLNTVADNSWVFAIVASNTKNSSADNVSSQTERWQISNAGDSSSSGGFAADLNGPKTPAGSQTMDWNAVGATTQDGAMAIISFKPTVGGGGGGAASVLQDDGQWFFLLE